MSIPIFRHRSYSYSKNILGSKHIVLLPFLLFCYLFFVNAWVCDDAYITFRTIDNFVNGHGLTWNTTERVQAYTHPLWMILMSIPYYITHEPYFTSIILSFVLISAGFWLFVYKTGVNAGSVAIGILTLCFSKAFIDYSSSGLENPLSYFLLLLFTYEYLQIRENVDSRLLRLSLFTSLIMLSRMDLVLLVLPILIIELWKNKSLHNVGQLLIGLSPIFAWELFSLIYYGFPFPNTAYSKLYSGVPAGALISQGIAYFINSMKNDPIALLTIFSVLGFVFSFSSYRKKYSGMAIGIVLYLLYIIKIGGDFMSGRFFATPLLIAVILLTLLIEEIKPKYIIATLFAIFIIGIIPSTSPIKSGSDFGSSREPIKQEWIANDDFRIIPFTDSKGITDERAFYYQECGLLPILNKGANKPLSPAVTNGILSSKSSNKLLVNGFIGMFGYYAGPTVYIIDPNALSSALLAHLPMNLGDGKRWRIGHFMRDLPKGYFESIKQSKNLISDNNIKELYSKIETITQKKLFAAGRIKEIIDFNLGKYNSLATSTYQIEPPDLFPFSGDTVSMAMYYSYIAKMQGKKNELTESSNTALSGNNINTRKYLADAERFAMSKSYKKLDDVISVLQQAGTGPDAIRDQYISWAKTVSSKGDNTGSIELLVHAQKTGFEHELLWNNIGIFYAKQQNADSAEKAWLEAIKRNPDYLPAYSNLFRLYYELQGNKEKARKIADQIVNHGGSRPIGNY